jgi:hypothetical protein
MDDDLFEQIQEQLLDGQAVDWNALSERTLSQSERRQLEMLRVLDAIRQHSRSGVTTSQHDLASGDRWGRYVITGVLGGGTFARVYRAEDPTLKTSVALKVLRFSDTPGIQRERLISEARKLAQIRHRHVVEVLPLEEHEGHLALVMRLVDGETLKTIADRRLLSAREAAEIGEELCTGLVVVHAADIVHRDIKSQNVMRDRNGDTVLVDFGSGEIVTATDERRDDPEGTPLYMAPELFTGAHASRQTDIYSAGVLLFFLVTGTFPVTGTDWRDLETAHRTHRRRRLSDIRPDLPADFRRLVERATAPDAGERYQSAGEMIEALEALRRERRPAVPTIVGIGAAVVAGVFVLGIVTSRHFNLVLGFSGFVQENPLLWLAKGGQASVAPALGLLAGLLLAGAAVAMCETAATLSPPLRRFGQACRAGATSAARARGLDDCGSQAALIVLVSAAALAIVLWSYSPLLSLLLFDDLTTADANTMNLLSTDHCVYRNSYQGTLIALGVLSLAVWTLVFKRARDRRTTINRTYLSGGVAVLALTVLCICFPWRVLNENNRVPATWQGAACFFIEQHGGQVLLYCPMLPDRTHIVNAAEVKVRNSKPESIFWPFSRKAMPETTCKT